MQDYIPDICSIITGLCSFVVVTLFDVSTNGVAILVGLMTIDWITGVAGAIVNPKLYLNSMTGAKGIIKKFIMLCIVSAGHLIDLFLGTGFIQQAIVYAYVGNEGLSILENSAKCGLPVPKKIVNLLEQLRGDNSVNN